MIRKAHAGDVDAIVLMGMRFVRETGYADKLARDPDKMREVVVNLMNNPVGFLIVSSDRDGNTDGMMGAILFSHPMSGELVASEMFWWVNPESRGAGFHMLKMAEEWAKNHGAERMMMIAPDDRVAKFYERIGYERVEATYSRRL